MATRMKRIWLLAGAALIAAAVIVLVMTTGTNDKGTGAPAASSSAEAPKTIAPSTPSLHDPVVRSRFESALTSCFEDPSCLKTP